MQQTALEPAEKTAGKKRVCSSPSQSKLLIAGDVFRKENVSCFFYLQKGKTLWLANRVDAVDKGLDIQMSVNTLGQAHGAGMTGNLLLDSGIRTGVGHHGNTGMAGVVRLVLFHFTAPVETVFWLFKLSEESAERYMQICSTLRLV